MEKEKTILNGNRLIAEFMGVLTDPLSNRTTHHFGNKELIYHKDWNWIMSAVEKIEKTTIGKDRFPVVTIEPGYCVVSDNGESPIREEQGESKIENVWFAVIGFIEWYNVRNA